MKKIKDFLISIEDFLELEREPDSIHNTHMYVVGFICVIVFIFHRILEENGIDDIYSPLNIINNFMSPIENQLVWIVYSFIFLLLVVCILGFLLNTIIIFFKKFYLLIHFIIQKLFKN